MSLDTIQREKIFQPTGRLVLPKVRVVFSSSVSCSDGRSHPSLHPWLQKVTINGLDEEDTAQ